MHQIKQLSRVALMALASLLISCGSSSGSSTDLGTADATSDTSVDAGVCATISCGANSTCVEAGGVGRCECTTGAVLCGQNCVLSEVDQRSSSSFAAWPAVVQDNSLECVGQPIEVGRAGLITAVRVAMTEGLSFTLDVVRVLPGERDIGATPADDPGLAACTVSRWRENATDAVASGAGVGLVTCPSLIDTCEEPLEYTTVSLDPPLEVTADDVVYVIAQFEEADWQQVPIFAGETAYPRGATNLGGTLVFETLVAPCE